MNFLIVSEVARRLGRHPREISDLSSARRLDDTRCPIVGGRRMIPPDSIPMIEEAIRRKGPSRDK
jgi:DNA-binding transcriptional regulator YdaS (Cro superfamily)